jgi:hypothetical protein
VIVRSCRGSAEPDASSNRVHAREKLEQPEGLGHIVIGAEPKPAHLIRFFPARREHDDRRLDPRLAQRSQDLVAVGFRQHQIEDDQVDARLLRARDPSRHRARPGRRDLPRLCCRPDARFRLSSTIRMCIASSHGAKRGLRHAELWRCAHWPRTGFTRV